jgi:hypothetical protein
VLPTITEGGPIGQESAVIFEYSRAVVGTAELLPIYVPLRPGRS